GWFTVTGELPRKGSRMTDDWYVRKGHKTLGPLSVDELRAVLEAGRITADTPVRCGPSGPWVPVEQALSDAASAKAPEKDNQKSRVPMTIIAVAGLAILGAGFWVVAEVNRRRDRPAIAKAPAEPATKSSDAVSSNAPIETTSAATKSAKETAPTRTAEV